MSQYRQKTTQKKTQHQGKSYKSTLISEFN